MIPNSSRLNPSRVSIFLPSQYFSSLSIPPVTILLESQSFSSINIYRVTIFLESQCFSSLNLSRVSIFLFSDTYRVPILLEFQHFSKHNISRVSIILLPRDLPNEQICYYKPPRYSKNNWSLFVSNWISGILLQLNVELYNVTFVKRKHVCYENPLFVEFVEFCLS